MFLRRVQRPDHVKCSGVKREVHVVGKPEFEVCAEVGGTPDLLTDYEPAQIGQRVGGSVDVFSAFWRDLPSRDDEPCAVAERYSIAEIQKEQSARKLKANTLIGRDQIPYL
jgi:hypothetical protein